MDSHFQSFLTDLAALVDRYREADTAAADAARAIHHHAQTLAATQKAKADPGDLPKLYDAFRAITEYVANDFQISPGLIDQSLRHCRTDRVSWARWICFLLCSEFTKASNPIIGDYFKSDRTTVLFGINRTHALIQKYPERRKVVDRLRAAIAELLTKTLPL